MDQRDHTINLYSSQASIVIDTISQDGVCFSKREYVAKKYEESAKIFLAAYDWFVKEAENYVQKPDGAEYPYWAFKDTDSIDASAGGAVLKLQVPIDEAIFFDVYDWNKILCLQYIGTSERDERNFKEMIRDYGIRRESDIILTNFYPDLKAQILESWKRLFVHHEAIRSGDHRGVRKVQAGLWKLEKEWILP